MLTTRIFKYDYPIKGDLTTCIESVIHSHCLDHCLNLAREMNWDRATMEHPNGTFQGWLNIGGEWKEDPAVNVYEIKV